MRLNRDLIRLLCVLALTAACHQGPPARPAAVPADAIWIGGAKGGAWIRCGDLMKEPQTGYSCTTYHESGDVWTNGEYLLATWLWDRDAHAPRFEPRVDPFASRPSYESFDGHIVYLHGNAVLVPHGWIDLPASKDHGKRVKYDRGKEVEESSY
jgi:hypothetical protein